MTLARGGREINVLMSGWGLADQDMDRWCAWFKGHMATVVPDDEWVTAKEVNFSKNQLTAVGTRLLLETLISCKVAVLVLKLHHNWLSCGEGIADFIVNSEGSLRELHLSHNDLDTQASADIILAASAARENGNGEHCYPVQSGSRGVAPLWLRLEQNRVDVTELDDIIQPGFAQLRRPGRPLCNASNRACTPHCCARHRRDMPAVHAKCLGNQRFYSLAGNRRTQEYDDWDEEIEDSPSFAEVDVVAPTAPTLLRRLDPSTEASSALDSDEEPTDAKYGEYLEEQGVIRAKVFIWEHSLGHWVPDEIDVPIRPDVSEDSPQGQKERYEEKPSPASANMALELKQLIGIGGNGDNALRALPKQSSRPPPRKVDAGAAASGILALVKSGKNPPIRILTKSSPKKRATDSLQAGPNGLNPEASIFIPKAAPSRPLPPPPPPPPKNTTDDVTDKLLLRTEHSEAMVEPVKVELVVTTRQTSTLSLNPEADEFVPSVSTKIAGEGDPVILEKSIVAEHTEPQPLLGTSPTRISYRDGTLASVNTTATETDWKLKEKDGVAKVTTAVHHIEQDAAEDTDAPESQGLLASLFGGLWS